MGKPVEIVVIKKFVLPTGNRGDDGAGGNPVEGEARGRAEEPAALSARHKFAVRKQSETGHPRTGQPEGVTCEHIRATGIGHPPAEDRQSKQWKLNPASWRLRK